MTIQSIQLESLLVGILLVVILMTLAAGLMLYKGRPVLRRLADWLLNRRGFEKLGRPIRVRPSNSPYERWLRTAKSEIPVHECLYIQDVRTLSLQPWPQHGKDTRRIGDR